MNQHHLASTPAQSTGASASLGEAVPASNYKTPDYTHFPKIPEVELNNRAKRVRHIGFLRRRLKLPRLQKVDLATDRSGSETASLISSILEHPDRFPAHLVRVTQDVYGIKNPDSNDDATLSIPRDTLYLYGHTGVDISPKKPESRRVRLVFHSRPFKDLNFVFQEPIYEGKQRERPTRKMNRKYLPALEKTSKTSEKLKRKSSTGKRKVQPANGDTSGTKFISDKSVTSVNFAQPAFKDIPPMPLCDVFRYKETMRRALAHGRPLAKTKETPGEKLLSNNNLMTTVSLHDLEDDGNDNKTVVFPIFVNFNEITSEELEEEIQYRKLKAMSQGRPILRPLEETPPTFLRTRVTTESVSPEELEKIKHRRTKRPDILKVKGRKSESNGDYEIENGIIARLPSASSLRELGHLIEDEDRGEHKVMTTPVCSDDVTGIEHDNDENDVIATDVVTPICEMEIANEVVEGASCDDANDLDPEMSRSPDEKENIGDADEWKHYDADTKLDVSATNNSRNQSRNSLRLELHQLNVRDDEEESIGSATTPSARLSPIYNDDVIEPQDDRPNSTEQQEDADTNENPQEEKESENNEEEPKTTQGENLVEDVEEQNHEQSQPQVDEEGESSDQSETININPEVTKQGESPRRLKSPRPINVTPRKTSQNRTKGLSLINGPFVFLPVALESIRNINELSKRVTVIDTDQYDKYRNERVYTERETDGTSQDDDDEYDEEEGRYYARHHKNDSPRSLQGKDDSPRSVQSKNDSPRSLQSKNDSPRSQQSKNDSPQQNKGDSPRNQQNKNDSPRSQPSKTNSPRSQQSKSDSPRSQQSKNDSPRSQEAFQFPPATVRKESRAPNERKMNMIRSLSDDRPKGANLKIRQQQKQQQQQQES